MADIETLERLTAASVLAEKVAEDQAERARQKQACDALIPRVVAEMVAHDRITPEQSDLLAEKLASHEETLRLLLKTAGHRNAAEAEADRLALGRPAGGGGGPVKRASYAPVGARRVERMPSDEAILGAFNIAPSN